MAQQPGDPTREMEQKEEDLKLLGVRMKPFVARVHLALKVKGLSYESIDQDLYNKSELLLKSNPVHKKVPVLIHNGQPICESFVIVQYIDEIFAGIGPSILPTDPYQRATARFWAAYVDDKFFPAWLGLMQAETEEGRAEKLKETSAVVEKLEEAFAMCSNGKAFFSGDSIGYMDLALGPFLFWFEALHKVFNVQIIDVSRTPLLAAWANRFGETAAVKEVVPGADEAVVYAMKLHANWAAAATTTVPSH